MNKQDALIEYKRLIESTAAAHVGGGVDLEDLKQEASIAFLEALEKWSPEKSAASFAGYASRRMTWRLRRLLQVAKKHRRAVSMDADNSEGFSLHDLIGEEAPQEVMLGEAEQRAVIAQALEKMPAAERAMLERWAAGSHRLVAKATGVSKSTSDRECRLLLGKLYRLLHRRVKLGAPRAVA